MPDVAFAVEAELAPDRLDDSLVEQAGFEL